MSGTPNRMKALLARVASGAPLNLAEARDAFEIMMSGDATPAQVGGFLMGLRVRGETVDELTGGAQALRERMLKVQAPDDAIDTCGTGGDASGTFNVSTAAAIVVAACGVPVAKHGNRALSSRAGSADILTALGVNIEADLALVERAIRGAGIGFMMAPRHHGAMRHVAGAGRARHPDHLQPARSARQPGGRKAAADGRVRARVGRADRAGARPARRRARLGGARRGRPGRAQHHRALARGRAARRQGHDLRGDPGAGGLPRARRDDLRGGDATTNADALRALLDGVRGPYRDIVVLNSAAALIVAGRVDDLAAGAARAVDAIDSGAAKDALRALIAITNEAAPGD